MCVNFDKYKDSEVLQRLMAENPSIQEYLNTLESMLTGFQADYLFSNDTMKQLNAVNKLIENESEDVLLWNDTLTKAIDECNTDKGTTVREIESKVDKLNKETLAFLDRANRISFDSTNNPIINEGYKWGKKMTLIKVTLLIASAILQGFFTVLLYETNSTWSFLWAYVSLLGFFFNVYLAVIQVELINDEYFVCDLEEGQPFYDEMYNITKFRFVPLVLLNPFLLFVFFFLYMLFKNKSKKLSTYKEIQARRDYSSCWIDSKFVHVDMPNVFYEDAAIIREQLYAVNSHQEARVIIEKLDSNLSKHRQYIELITSESN